MTDPTTTNVLFAVPTRGSDPGTWDTPVNANTTSLDGYLGGFTTVSVSGSPVTLTAPAGTATPGAGPYQSQNRTLKFTGALSSNVAITLPLPGEYTIINQTTGSFVLTFNAASAGNIVSTPQGSIMKVWCDGTDVWLIKNGIPGSLTFLGGVSAVPAWISACSVKPFLLCDGTVYTISTYPGLGNLYLGTFGGNGVTTFGVEDLRGRVPLAYDGTGTRITTAGCGINGQTLGASADNQSVTLTANQIPTITAANTAAINLSVTSTVSNIDIGTGNFTAVANPGSTSGVNGTGSVTSTGTIAIGNAAVTSNNTGSALHTNVQPSQVAGIWLVAT